MKDKICCLLVITVIFNLSYAQKDTKNTKYKSHTNSINIYNNKKIFGFLTENFNHNQVGLVVHSLDENKILYEHNINKLFIPASLVKLFTLAGGLKELTPEFKFKTVLKWDPVEFKNNKLKSDLGLVFSGDPSFNHNDLKNLIGSIKDQGIKTLSGNIIVDDTMFLDLYGDGWTIDDLPWGYAAPSGSIIVNENKIPIKVKPITNLGQTVEFFIDEKYKEIYPLAKINSKVIAVTKQESEHNCKLNININDDNYPFFSGCAQLDNSTQSFSLALNSPNNYLKSLLIRYLKENNVNFLGKIIFDKVPNRLIELKVHESLPLIDLSKVMINHSNNIYAHSIGKAIGVKAYGVGSFKNSTKALVNILENQFTVETSNLDLIDTSGLSNYNLAAPKHFIDLLKAIYNDRKLNANVANILTKPGQEGTLKNRLTSPTFKDRIIAKTGNLRNSSGIAGYIKNTKGQLVAFVFMVNNIVQDRMQIKHLTDELCELLINLE